MDDTNIRDTELGLAVRQALDNARKLGFHAAAPNFFLRVEFKSVSWLAPNERSISLSRQSPPLGWYGWFGMVSANDYNSALLSSPD